MVPYNVDGEEPAALMARRRRLPRQQSRHGVSGSVWNIDDLGAAGRAAHEHHCPARHSQCLRKSLQRRRRGLTVDGLGTYSDDEGAIVRPTDHGSAGPWVNPHDYSHGSIVLRTPSSTGVSSTYPEEKRLT